MDPRALTHLMWAEAATLSMWVQEIDHEWERLLRRDPAGANPLLPAAPPASVWARFDAAASAPPIDWLIAYT